MRHYKKGRKLGTDKSHTKAMKRNLVSALFLNDRIITIESRAKEIRPDVDKIIKWAKRGDLHSRRLAIAALGGDKWLVQEIFDKVSQGMFKERNSGYTRIIKLGSRKGDNAKMVIIELINEGKKRVSKPKDAAAKDGSKKEDSKKAEDKKSNDKKESKTETKKDENKKESKAEAKTSDNKKSEKKASEKKQEENKEPAKKADDKKEPAKKVAEKKEPAKKDADDKKKEDK